MLDVKKQKKKSFRCRKILRGSSCAGVDTFQNDNIKKIIKSNSSYQGVEAIDFVTAPSHFLSRVLRNLPL